MALLVLATILMSEVCLAAALPAFALQSLHEFDQGVSRPSSLAEGRDGNFYGTSAGGGVFGHGTVFKLTPDGTLTILISFNGTNGSFPEGGLVRGSDGNFYGTTARGGRNYPRGEHQGTVFRVTLAGELTTLFSFMYEGTNGYGPGPLIDGRDGHLYGMTTRAGANGMRTVFRITPGRVLTTLVSLTGTDDSISNPRLTLGNDGNFYGPTARGLLKVTPAGVVTTWDSFIEPNGSAPNTPLLAGWNGNLYGRTSIGGRGGAGTGFQVSPEGATASRVSFTVSFNSELIVAVRGTDGNFYGTTSGDGTGNSGTVFKLRPGGDLSTIARFNGANGARPNAPLALGNDGHFYGTTFAGGITNTYWDPRFGGLWIHDSLGTIFKITADGALTVLLAFDGTNGMHPEGGLVKGKDGNFYGTTQGGGIDAFTLQQLNPPRTMFRITPGGELTTLVTFSGTREFKSMVVGTDGHFYGTTDSGGPWRAGTVQRIAPSGEVTTVVSFNYTNGAQPAATLALANDGTFYGTTQAGGAGGRGTVFNLTPSGELTTLISFNGANGAFPHGGLVQGIDGNLYGTTSFGGAGGGGTVFRLVPAPVLAATERSTRDLLLSWGSFTGGVYQLEYTTKLPATNWTVLAGDVTASGTTASATDSLVGAQRYYRVRLLP